jgi:hypothetical protein
MFNIERLSRIAGDQEIRRRMQEDQENRSKSVFHEYWKESPFPILLRASPDLLVSCDP